MPKLTIVDEIKSIEVQKGLTEEDWKERDKLVIEDLLNLM